MIDQIVWITVTPNFDQQYFQHNVFYIGKITYFDSWFHDKSVKI
jgi:hypothetical protein